MAILVTLLERDVQKGFFPVYMVFISNTAGDLMKMPLTCVFYFVAFVERSSLVFYRHLPCIQEPDTSPELCLGDTLCQRGQYAIRMMINLLLLALYYCFS